MVLQLATSLGVPLRQVNAMLRAAGHEPVYDESDDALPGVGGRRAGAAEGPPRAVPARRRRSHLPGARPEPGARRAARRDPRATDAAIEPGARRPAGLNLARLTFDPDGAQPHLVNFDEVGRAAAVAHPARGARRPRRRRDARPARRAAGDADRRPRLAPRRPGWCRRTRPWCCTSARGGLDLRFLTMITAFQAPQNVAVEHLRIETWFPYDEATAEACRLLGGGAV